MSYKDLDLKISYISIGDENIANSFLTPALKQTKLYQRSVGYFSSSVFSTILDPVVAMSRNGGKIQLIASPKLSSEDVQAIETGYEKRESIIKNSFTNDFVMELENLSDSNLKLLVELIANETLDIKIAVTDTIGDYHDKLGILEDFDNNTIVFYGSANSSLNGYKNNYEKIRVVKSWLKENEPIIQDEKKEFLSLWNGTNPFVRVYDYKEIAKLNLLDVIEKRKTTDNNQPIVLRDYQNEAISAWVNNNYNGFFVMATGTGKTWTAIYAAKELIAKHSSMIVICAPYKHLVKQWADDVNKAFPNSKIIMVSSENPFWEQQISQEIIRKQYNQQNQIIIISTIASFNKVKFTNTISKSKDEKLLIVDEAHRFTDRSDELKDTFNYMLGLSATPFSGFSPKKGLELMEFFGGQVFDLPIEQALKKKYLVSYNYCPIYVYATEEEEERFRLHSKKIASCFQNGRCTNPDLLVKSLRNRLRVISMAEEKQEQLDEILKKIKEQDHIVVYCGDGRLHDNTGEEIRHIQAVKRKLTAQGYKSSQFTAEEDMKTRMELVDAFNKGEITALAAIRCLDEGINIPSIKSALILSSNDDYREFVQRRGRILRTYKGKQYANIYDIIVLPSADLQAWAKIEFRRYLEYAKLSINKESLQNELERYLEYYNLSIEDIDVYDYENMEVEEDE